MIKKTFEFEDFDGNVRKEDHWFGLNNAEVTKWLMTDGEYTLDKILERLRTERNYKKIMEVFDNLIRISYGRKSLDGRKFEKSDEIWEDFYRTEAYSQLFTELVYDAKKAAEFVNGIMPKNLADGIEEIIKQNSSDIPAEIKDYLLTNN